MEQDKPYNSTYEHNIEAPSFNYCGSGKTISITYFECVSVALSI